MMKKIVHFVQYHNFFSIAVMVVFMGASVSFAASPQLRQGVLAQTEMARSVDNSYVVNTDFDNYDMGLKIQSVTEDAGIYYIDYTYNVVEVKDYIWQPVGTNGSIKVSKKELSGRDLGLYVANQLGQMIDQQISYLKEVQTKEKKTGVTQKVLAVEYSGLVGQFLSTDEKTFEGYSPVVTPPPPPLPPPPPEQQEQVAAVVESQDVSVPEVVPQDVVVQDAPTTSVSTPVVVQNTVTREEIEQLIRARVAELLAEGNSSTQPAPAPAQEPTPTPAPEPEPEPASPAPESAVEPAPAPEPTPTVEPTPEPTQEQTPAPEPTPTTESTTPVETPTPTETPAT